MIRLFCDCVYVREDELARVLPGEGLRALESLDLLARDPDTPGLVFATAAILLTAQNLTVCDRGNAPDGTKCTLPPDVVYPAIFENTREFVDRLPQTPCEAMLDIGTGTGIAAMRGAPYAGHVWATDISARCTLFAEFNRRLAGLENMTVVEGDMYAPVEGLTFDRIVTHPPYIPARQTELIFRDGGEDGEQIIRRAVEGLPRFLRPGGKFYALLMATDREGEDFEQRIRKWLGADEGSFDVILVSDWLHTPAELLAREAGQRSPDQRRGMALPAGDVGGDEDAVYLLRVDPDPPARGRPAGGHRARASRQELHGTRDGVAVGVGIGGARAGRTRDAAGEPADDFAHSANCTSFTGFARDDSPGKNSRWKRRSRSTPG